MTREEMKAIQRIPLNPSFRKLSAPKVEDVKPEKGITRDALVAQAEAAFERVRPFGIDAATGWWKELAPLTRDERRDVRAALAKRAAEAA